MVQDLATQRLQAYPCETKTSKETQKSLMKFLEPTRKPKVIYTDNSLKFCEELSWNHCTSTPYRLDTNGIAERAVRRVKDLQYCCNQVPKHKWPKSWSRVVDPVVPLERNLYGHLLAGLLLERQFEIMFYQNMVGKKFRIGNVYSLTEKNDYSCLCVWIS